ncbi:MAG TPA: S9 family peptidase [Gemmatales bacterium]|nr:S9 family peptidase [Gemmatales bacterium]
MSCRWACLLVAVSGLAAVQAQERPASSALTAESLWRLQRLGPPTLSPDGQWCALEVTRWDIDKDESFSEIWLFSTDGQTKRQLTQSGGKNSSPKWSPTGDQIAFISKRGTDEQPQIYVINPSGGEARRLTSLPFAPSGLKWARDGLKLFFIGWTWPDTPDDAAHRQRDKELKDRKSKAMVIDDATYRYWDRWIADGRRPHVFTVDFTTGQHRNLLAGSGRHLPPYEPSDRDYDVSPDGRELCFVSENVKEIGLDLNHDLFTLPIPVQAQEPAPQEAKNLTTDNPANDTSPVYSPDGQQIAFLRQRTKFFYADQTDLMLIERSSGAIGSALTQFDRSVSNPTFATCAAGTPIFLFEAERDGGTRCYFAPRSGPKAGTPQPFTAGPSDRGLAASSGTAVFLRSSFCAPPRLMTQPLDLEKAAEARPLSHFDQETIDAWPACKIEERQLPGFEGKEIQTFIIYPPDFDPSRKWPLVQMVHGGPHNAFTNDWSFRWNPRLWAAQGWVVTIVNFHGSSGFGQEFTDSITGDYGTKPLADILKTTQWLEQQPWVDKERMAAAGASYGGYMMAYLNGHTDKFKAMVCHAGVYSYASQMASDIVVSRKRALGGFPWDDYDRMDRQSANRFAQNFKTPTLVLHGEKDYRVPVTQGFEYYNTLKQKGVPARLVYFPDENHWILKPQNSLLWHREVFDWLTKYIGSGPT